MDVIDPALWELVLPDPIDPSVTCGELAMTMEEGLVEVNTAECNHVTLEQPALAGVRVDDALDVFAFHSALSAPEPGEGRIALWLDGELTWERTPPIPSSEAIYLDTVDSPVRIRRGDPVRSRSRGERRRSAARARHSADEKQRPQLGCLDMPLIRSFRRVKTASLAKLRFFLK